MSWLLSAFPKPQKKKKKRIEGPQSANFAFRGALKSEREVRKWRKDRMNKVLHDWTLDTSISIVCIVLRAMRILIVFFSDTTLYLQVCERLFLEFNRQMDHFSCFNDPSFTQTINTPSFNAISINLFPTYRLGVNTKFRSLSGERTQITRYVNFRSLATEWAKFALRLISMSILLSINLKTNSKLWYQENRKG